MRDLFIYLLHYFLPVSIVMGIPTVKREVKSYLIETLHSLIDNLYPEEKLDCVIVVFIGEVSIFFILYNLKCEPVIQICFYKHFKNVVSKA
jgi:hypothetical protein